MQTRRDANENAAAAPPRGIRHQRQEKRSQGVKCLCLSQKQSKTRTKGLYRKQNNNTVMSVCLSKYLLENIASTFSSTTNQMQSAILGRIQKQQDTVVAIRYHQHQQPSEPARNHNRRRRPLGGVVICIQQNTTHSDTTTA